MGKVEWHVDVTLKGRWSVAWVGSKCSRGESPEGYPSVMSLYTEEVSRWELDLSSEMSEACLSYVSKSIML